MLQRPSQAVHPSERSIVSEAVQSPADLLDHARRLATSLGRGSVAAQAFQALRLVSPWRLRNDERAFFVELSGEHADDYGGPYREIMAAIEGDVQPEEGEEQSGAAEQLALSSAVAGAGSISGVLASAIAGGKGGAGFGAAL